MFQLKQVLFFIYFFKPHTDLGDHGPCDLSIKQFQNFFIRVLGLNGQLYNKPVCLFFKGQSCFKCKHNLTGLTYMAEVNKPPFSNSSNKKTIGHLRNAQGFMLKKRPNRGCISSFRSVSVVVSFIRQLEICCSYVTFWLTWTLSICCLVCFQQCLEMW